MNGKKSNLSRSLMNSSWLSYLLLRNGSYFQWLTTFMSTTGMGYMPPSSKHQHHDDHTVSFKSKLTIFLCDDGNDDRTAIAHSYFIFGFHSLYFIWPANFYFFSPNSNPMYGVWSFHKLNQNSRNECQICFVEWKYYANIRNLQLCAKLHERRTKNAQMAYAE